MLLILSRQQKLLLVDDQIIKCVEDKFYLAYSNKEASELYSKRIFLAFWAVAAIGLSAVKEVSLDTLCKLLQE